MAYVLDFTAAEHARRKMLRMTCGVMTVIVLVIFALGAHITRQIYESPTLAERLVAYQAEALKLEEISELWKTTAGEYNALLPYYRLIWSDGITNALPGLIAWMETKPVNVVPRKWKIAAGGDCVLVFSLNLEPKQKLEQLTVTRGWVFGVTNYLDKALSAKVEAPATTGDLGELKTVEMTLRFNLKPNYGNFTPPVPELEAACAKIKSLREKLHAYVIRRAAVGQTPITLDSLIIEETKDLDAQWKNRRIQVIDPERLWKDMDDAGVKAVSCNRELWRKFATAKWPWRRARALELLIPKRDVQELNDIATVLPRKSVFMKQRGIMATQRSPLLAGYTENDVFNENLAKEQLLAAVQTASVSGSVKMERGKEGVEVETVEKDAADKPVLEFVNFVDWTLSVEKVGTGSFGLSSLRHTVEAILGLKSGFELGVLDVEFSSGNELQKAVLTGKVPVHK